MKTRVGEAALAAGLVAVLGWPVLATALAALETGAGGPPTAGLIVAPPDSASGGVRRPLGLAFETARLVLATEALALPVGLPLALILFRTDAWGRRGLLGLVAVAALVPMPLHATAWLGALGNVGRAQALGSGPVLVGWPGAAFVHAAASLPWIILLAGLGLRTVEPELEDAARLDLPGGRVALRVTLRRGVGAVAGAALAVAVLTAGDMTVTDLLQVRTYAEEAYLQYNLGNGPGAAGAVALPPLAGLGVLVGLGARRLLSTDPARLASASSGPRPFRLGSWRVPAGAAAWALLGNVLAWPLVSLVWRAGRVGGSAASGRPPHWSASGLLGTLRFAWEDAAEPLVQSLVAASAGATAAVVLAWGLAWVCRLPGPWRGVTAASVAVALALPGPVAGMALVFAYRSIPAVYDAPVMVVLAAVARTFPFALLVLWPAVRTIPPALLDAGRVEGLDGWGLVRRVGLPMTRVAALGAWGVAFVLALGELPATNLVTPPGFTPLSVVIWGLLHTGVESHLAGVVLVMLAAVAVPAGLTAAVLGRLVRRSSPSNDEQGGPG